MEDIYSHVRPGAPGGGGGGEGSHHYNFYGNLTKTFYTNSHVWNNVFFKNPKQTRNIKFCFIPFSLEIKEQITDLWSLMV